MSKYDFTLLLTEEEATKNIKTLVNSVKGKVEKEDKWGKKTLAYPIKKHTNLYYFNWLIDLSENQLAEFKKKLKFEEKLVRYLLLKIT